MFILNVQIETILMEESNNNMLQWAKELMDIHKNPRQKPKLPSTKLFIPNNSEQEKGLVADSLKSVLNSLKNERVERRCARATGIWLPEKRLVQVTKVVGIVNTFGFANKTGRYLRPEEAMFLLETNRLELFWNNVPISIQQAYEVIINKLPKYLGYRKLALEGFRFSKVNKESQEENDEPLTKRIKYENTTEPCSSQSTSTLEANPLTEIWKRAKETGPKIASIERMDCGDYEIFVPESSKHQNSSFQLNLQDSNVMDTSLGFMDEKTIVGFPNNDFTGYFQFMKVNLPSL